jgi:hypothetical protein
MADCSPLQLKKVSKDLTEKRTEVRHAQIKVEELKGDAKAADIDVERVRGEIKAKVLLFSFLFFKCTCNAFFSSRLHSVFIRLLLSPSKRLLSRMPKPRSRNSKLLWLRLM